MFGKNLLQREIVGTKSSKKRIQLSSYKELARSRNVVSLVK